jgi:RND family efflux transporter MFP subunit
MLGVQSARIGYSGAQESYYNTVTSTETNLEDTIDNSLSSIVSGITLIESAAQLSEQIQNDDEDLYEEYDDLLDEYDDIKNDNDVHDTIYLIEDVLDGLEDSQEVLLDLKDDTDDPTSKSSVTALITSIDQSKSGLNMAVQGLNNSLLGAEAQPEGAFTGMESAETGVLSAKQALNIARANQKSQLDSLANAVELSQKQLNSAIAQLENVKAKADLQVIAAETQLAQVEGQANLAETNLEGTIVKSPIQGTLLQKFAKEGNYVNPSQTIAEIGDMSKVYIIVSLTAEELKFVKLGQDVQIEAPGGITKTGKITKVLPALDPVTKKVQVKILIPNKDKKLISGMFTDVLFSDAQKDSVGALVPFKSIIFETNGRFVYVIENNKAVKKSVKLGQIVGSDIEITEGLNQGDKIITKGAKLVNEGDLVKNISDNK